MSGHWQRAITEFFTVFRFGIVGVAATLTHMLFALVALNQLGLAPIPANLIGFLVAFAVSFGGHSYWTFRGHGAAVKTSLVRLLIVAVFSLLLNNAVLWLLVEQTLLSDDISIIIAVLVVPPVTYLLSKFWVFRS
jgi:putative flippase GtrA